MKVVVGEKGRGGRILLADWEIDEFVEGFKNRDWAAIRQLGGALYDLQYEVKQAALEERLKLNRG